MKKNLLPITHSLFFLLLFVTTACDDNVEIIDKSYYTGAEYRTITATLNLPPSLHDYNHDNSIQNISPKATLGRVLFYDKHLSADKTVSCASCHDQAKAFSDDVAFSTGIENRVTTRNSITIAAVSDFEQHYSGGSQVQPLFFWDERAATLKEQMEETIENPLEMGMVIENLADVLSDKKYYQILFEKAFRTTDIKPDMVLDALEAFVNSIRTSKSKFDFALETTGQGSLHNHFSRFSYKENLGKTLFLQNCTSCHGFTLNSPTSRFTSNVAQLTVANNGLDMEYADQGMATHTNRVGDRGVFKIPGLRNIELTAPYMHDGRFETLEEVVNFYSEGIQAHPNLNIRLQEDGKPKRLNFDATEKEALVAFLKTLTGNQVTREEKWSDPFL